MATNKVLTVTVPATRTGDTVDGYNIYSDEEGLLDLATPAEAAAGHTITLTDNLEHSITAKAVFNLYGESSLSSNVVVVDLVIPAIAAPTNLLPGTPTSSTIPLTWTKSITGVMTAYRVYDDGVLLQTFTGDVAAGTLTGLTASTTYTNLTVRAYNGTSESASSNAINATTAAASGTPPAQPSIIASYAVEETADNPAWSLVWESDFATSVGKAVGFNGSTVSVASSQLRIVKTTGAPGAFAINHTWVASRRYRVEIEGFGNQPGGVAMTTLGYTYTWNSKDSVGYKLEFNPQLCWFEFIDGQETPSLDTCIVTLGGGATNEYIYVDKIRLYELP